MSAPATFQTQRDAGAQAFGLGDYRRAAQLFEEAAASLRESGIPETSGEEGDSGSSSSSSVEEELAKVTANVAACWLRLGNFPRAYKSASEAVASDAQYFKAYLRRARALAGQHLFALAKADLETALQLLGGENEEVQGMLDELEEARVELANGRPQRPRRRAARKLQRKQSTWLVPAPGSFYEALGVERDASSGEIKRAFRDLALLLHPDKNHAASEGAREELEARFKVVSEAYGVLSDASLRAQYDAGATVEDMEEDELFTERFHNVFMAHMFAGRWAGGGGPSHFYQCDDCGKAFGSERALLDHEDATGHGGNVFYGDDPYVCAMCAACFGSAHALEAHERDTGHGVCYCLACGRTFTTERALEQHAAATGHGLNSFFDEDTEDEDVLNADEYYCEACERGFTSLQGLVDHCSAVHETSVPTPDERKFGCAQCDRAFTSSRALSDHHVATGHVGRAAKQDKASKKKKKQKTKQKQKQKNHGKQSKDKFQHKRGKAPPSATPQYSCFDCGYRSHTQQGLTAHQRAKRHGEFYNPDSDSDYVDEGFSWSYDSLEDDQENAGGFGFAADSLACVYCGREFESMHALEMHNESKHPLQTSFQCSACARAFQTPAALDAHEEAEHAICPGCDEVFVHERAMDQHYAAKHVSKKGRAKKSKGKQGKGGFKPHGGKNKKKKQGKGKRASGKQEGM